MSEATECAHPACRCKVEHGEAYCSDRCRKQVESPLSDDRAGCPCGHAACGAAHDEPNQRK